MAEIEVDIELGTVRVLKVTAAHDVGRAINPTLIEGQIEGGVAQGLGMALMEEFFPGKGENLHDYLIPSVGRHSSSGIDSDRRPVADRAVWSERDWRTGGDSYRAGDSECAARCDRHAPAQDSGDARPRARGDSRGAERRGCVADDAIRCDACPVLCYIKPGRTGSCDRYGNHDGQLVRLDPHVMLERAQSRGDSLVPFLGKSREWDGILVGDAETFVTAIGAGTTYPDYKPAPFIISSEVAGVDMVTVVTEGIFSYCGVKLKIDTDRHLGRGVQHGARAGRTRRSRHHRRIRIADALARRRSSSDRRQPSRRHRHLRHAAESVQRQSRRTGN